MSIRYMIEETFLELTPLSMYSLQHDEAVVERTENALTKRNHQHSASFSDSAQTCTYTRLIQLLPGRSQQAGVPIYVLLKCVSCMSGF